MDSENTLANHDISVGTGCIDKKSSAELNEAINSMYRWYKQSSLCFVYLGDVPTPSKANEQTIEQAFRRSKWWTRGWTLQELLAPDKVEFYDCAWNRILKIGEKMSLSDLIAEISGIRSIYLTKKSKVASASIATRMSWASRRQTTRPEDIAYCLLGLFDVNMPLLYGEGGVKAYTRLQLEIIKKSDDESIFAWKSHRVSFSHVSGILAERPAWFNDSGSFHSIVLRTPIFEQKPYSMTNRGLKIRLPSAPAEDGFRYVLLHCCAGCETSSTGRDIGMLEEHPQQHHWLAIRMLQITGARWIRDGTMLSEMDHTQFAIDAKAMLVIQGNL